MWKLKEPIHDNPTDPAERSKCQCHTLLQLERSIQNKMATNRNNNIILLMITALFAESSAVLPIFNAYLAMS